MKRSKTPCSISDSLHRQLNWYALAASAAGVGALALAQPAEAKIVYTPTHVVIDDFYYLDLNHDGVPDFVFASWTNCGPPTSGCWISFSIASPIRGKNAIAEYYKSGRWCAYALQKGASIGSKRVFQGAADMWPAWYNVKDRYVGLRFLIKAKPHYGWARLNVHYYSQGPSLTATLSGSDYETTPNEPTIAGKTKGPDVITTPEPASLSRLARGSAGLAAKEPISRAH